MLCLDTGNRNEIGPCDVGQLTGYKVQPTKIAMGLTIRDVTTLLFVYGWQVDHATQHPAKRLLLMSGFLSPILQHERAPELMEKQTYWLACASGCG